MDETWMAMHGDSWTVERHAWLDWHVVHASPTYVERWTNHWTRRGATRHLRFLVSLGQRGRLLW